MLWSRESVFWGLERHFGLRNRRRSLALAVAVCVGSHAVADYVDLPFYSRAKAEARLLPLRPVGDRAIRIDGDLADWGDMREDSFALHQLLDHTVPDFHQSWKREWEAHATDAALIKLLRDENALYIAIKVADNSVISPADEGKRLDGDVIDMYLDLRPASGKEPTIGHVKYTEGMYQVVFAPPTPDGQSIHILQPENERFTDWKSGQKVARLGAFEAESRRVEGGYTVEVRLPLDSFPHGPARDRLTRPIGFEVMIADSDTQRPEGQPARMYYSCSGYSGGNNYFKSPATIACTDPDLQTRLPLSRLRANPLKTAPGGDECEGWIITDLKAKDTDAAFAGAGATVPGYTPPGPREKPLVTYPCPALDLAFHHRNVLSRHPARAPATVGNRYYAVHPAAGREVKIDGKLSDWDGFVETAARIDQYGCMPHCVGLPDRRDVAWVKLICEEDTLYVGVRVRDDSVINPGGAEKRFAGDCAQLFLDVRSPDAEPHAMSSGTYSDGVYHFYLAPATQDGREAAYCQGPQNVRTAGKLDFASARTRDGYEMEVAVPLASLMGNPVRGRFRQAFGFEIMFTDIDVRDADDLAPLVVYSWTGSAERHIHGEAHVFACADYLPNRLPEVRALVDTTPVNIAADFSAKRHAFSGFGGNYMRDGSLTHKGGRASRFGPTAANTLHVARHMDFKWARVNLHLFTWEWVNDNDDPDRTDMSRFKTRKGQPDYDHHEDPGPHYKVQVDRYLSILKQWVSEDTRLCAYADSFPDWLLSKKNRNAIDREMWPEFAECLVSYMTYAKETQGIEFDFFALKDARWGYPGFHANEADYPELLKFLGARFREHGLKTKLLLCDTTHQHNFRWYAAMIHDEQLLKHIGGIGLQTSGPLDAGLVTYRLWSDLAEHAGLPLLITKFGRPYPSSPTYLFQEVRIWQQLNLELSPNAAMLQQFIGERAGGNKWNLLFGKTIREDKERGLPVLGHTPLADEPDDVLTTTRWWFTKQFCELTPEGHAVAVASDHPRVMVTAFTGRAGGKDRRTLHISNAGPARRAAISGLPGKIKSMRMVRSGSGEGFRDAGKVKIDDGNVALDLPPWSLVSLTTMPRER